MTKPRGILFSALPQQENVPSTRLLARGFEHSVAGVIYQGHEVRSGMPLGGVDTGFIDLDPHGTWGACTLFNSHVPRRGPLNLPFLGLQVAGRTWVLSTTVVNNVDDPVGYGSTASRPTKTADRISYWGHYPMVDLQYDLQAPIEVALRAWTPFIPGDLDASTLPVAVFDVHMRNSTSVMHEGRLAFSFPGPTRVEAGGEPLQRRRLLPLEASGLNGVEVTAPAAAYVVAALTDGDVWTGECLGTDTGAWGRIDKGLPTAAPGDLGAAVSVPLAIAPGAQATVTFVLAWHSPMWAAAGHPDPASPTWIPWQFKGDGCDARADQTYRHMYAQRHPSALGAARYAAQHHHALRQRVLSWQAAVYNERELPDWLQDALINVLHLVPRTAFWASAGSPLGSWCGPEDGLFALNEDPRYCPQMECVPCSFYGNYPVVYLFPELALSTLRGYKAYQYEDGEVAWIFGGCTDKPPTPPLEMASATRGYQTTTNGPCVVDMVYRFWRRTGDRAVLVEFWDLVKRSTIFTMNLRPESGPAGIISFPTENKGLEWFEACTWAGMAAHVGGIHLANLLMAEDMARAIGDEAFAAQCRTWFAQGSEAMETKLWADGYYLNYLEEETGRRSDLVMANQLDGEWMSRLAGLGHVFRADRIAAVLDTIRKTCIASTPFGAVNFATPDGQPAANGEGRPGWGMHPAAFFVPEVFMLGMTYMYFGDRKLGLDLCGRCWGRVVELGRVWDQPNLIRGDTGEVIYGGDYYQNMIVWALPAALHEEDVAGPTKGGGFIERVLTAAQATSAAQSSGSFE